MPPISSKKSSPLGESSGSELAHRARRARHRRGAERCRVASFRERRTSFPLPAHEVAASLQPTPECLASPARLLLRDPARGKRLMAAQRSHRQFRRTETRSTGCKADRCGWTASRWRTRRRPALGRQYFSIGIHAESAENAFHARPGEGSNFIVLKGRAELDDSNEAGTLLETNGSVMLPRGFSNGSPRPPRSRRHVRRTAANRPDGGPSQGASRGNGSAPVETTCIAARR